MRVRKYRETDIKSKGRGEMMLTQKQEEFAKCIVEGMSQIDAYKKAYNAEGMTDNSISREASLLMDNPKITQRIKELRDMLSKPSILTAQQRLEYLSRIITGEEKELILTVLDGGQAETEKPVAINTRLKAVDIMNKMQGDYTTNAKVTVTYEDRLKEVVGEDEY